MQKGASGGVLALWDRTSLEKIESERGCYLLSCKFKNEDDNFFALFLESIAINLIKTGRCYGRNLKEYIVGRRCLGV